MNYSLLSLKAAFFSFYYGLEAKYEFRCIEIALLMCLLP